jgi:biopolymer transport protein ExbD
MNLRKKMKGGQEMHAGALNDILFILLFFFLIVATLGNPNVLKLSTPKAKSDTKAKQSVVVNIRATGEYVINGKNVSLDEMKSFIQPYISKDTAQATIAINADKTVPLDQVVAVMRVARDLGARSTLLVDTKTP